MIRRTTLAIEEARDQLRRHAQYEWIELYCNRELADILRITQGAEDELESVIHRLQDLR